ncbi:hypothetical protein BDB00DRAFT_820545, partial [Zychaea mexicana]|uniref:uncharacterized protein n=1 Tax=Zychaea mexicana TaxID=64656 RepID=UPI0022FF1C62
MVYFDTRANNRDMITVLIRASIFLDMEKASVSNAAAFPLSVPVLSWLSRSNRMMPQRSLPAIRSNRSQTSQPANSKRKLSAVDEIEREKIGRRLDTIYVASNLEFGGLEAAANRDNSKEFHDAKLKLPMVLRDMLSAIVRNGITMMDMNMPKGYVTRVRPPISNSDDYTGRVLSLLELAANAKTIVDDTVNLCTNTRVGMSVSGAGSTLVPPSFIATAAQESPSTTASKIS